MRTPRDPVCVVPCHLGLWLSACDAGSWGKAVASPRVGLGALNRWTQAGEEMSDGGGGILYRIKVP